MDSEIRCLTATTRRATIATGGKLAAVLGLFSAGLIGQPSEAKKKKKTINLQATLLGSNEVPQAGAGDPNASGTCSFTVKGTQICGVFNLTTTPVSPVSGNHIHQGASGANGPDRGQLPGNDARPAGLRDLSFDCL